VTPMGLKYDRQWMIVEEETHRFLTARTIPKVFLRVPAFGIRVRIFELNGFFDPDDPT
jgi:uncharacterized protein YcbX